MSQEDRLLTKHEVEVAINPMLGLVKRFFGVHEKAIGRDAYVCVAQDTKSYAQGVKDVGELLDRRMVELTKRKGEILYQPLKAHNEGQLSELRLLQFDLEALRQGKMPGRK